MKSIAGLIIIFPLYCSERSPEKYYEDPKEWLKLALANSYLAKLEKRKSELQMQLKVKREVEREPFCFCEECMKEHNIKIGKS